MRNLQSTSDELLAANKFIFTRSLKKAQHDKDEDGANYYLRKLSEIDAEILLRKQPKQTQA